MKVRLLHPDRDLDLASERGRTVLRLPTMPGADDLVDDLQLSLLFDAMGAEDPLCAEVGRAVVLADLDDIDAEVVRRRQAVVEDVIRSPAAVEELYQLACAAVADQKAVYRSVLTQRSESRLHSAVELMTLLLARLYQLHELGGRISHQFESDAFRRLFRDVGSELDDAYLDRIQDLLHRLASRGGLLISGELGEANQGSGFLVRVPDAALRGWFHKEPLHGRTSSFTIPARDEASAAALGELRDSVLESVSVAVNEALDHVVALFEGLRFELAFFLGCVRLRDRILSGGGEVTMPLLDGAWSATTFIDAGLALRKDETPVGHDFDAGTGSLVVITGENGGGKSTFLRGLGIAALMARSGMFVTASRASIPCVGRVHTHFRREEDAAMRHGKFDDELARMSDIVGRTRPGDLVLCNESFAATNEREGSQIGAAVIEAFLDSGVGVVLVTHMYALASQLEEERGEVGLFLRARRGSPTASTFDLTVGRATTSSGAAELFEQIIDRQRGPMA